MNFCPSGYVVLSRSADVAELLYIFLRVKQKSRQKEILKRWKTNRNFFLKILEENATKKVRKTGA